MRNEEYGISGYAITAGQPVMITASDEVVTATVICPEGKVAVGGGAALANGGMGGGIRLVESYPIVVGNAYGWRVTVANNWGETTTLTPYVIGAKQVTLGPFGKD